MDTLPSTVVRYHVLWYFAAPHSTEARKNLVIATFRLLLGSMTGNWLPYSYKRDGLLKFGWPRTIFLIEANTWLSTLVTLFVILLLTTVRTFTLIRS